MRAKIVTTTTPLQAKPFPHLQRWFSKVPGTPLICFSVVCRDVSLKLFQLLHLPVTLYHQWLWYYEEVGSSCLLSKTLHQPNSSCAILSEFEEEDILISAALLIFIYWEGKHSSVPHAFMFMGE